MTVYLFGLHDAEQGEEESRQQSGDGQGESLCTPEHRHQPDHIGTAGLLEHTYTLSAPHSQSISGMEPVLAHSESIVK